MDESAYYEALEAWGEAWRLLVAGVAAWRCQVPGEAPTDGELVALRERERATWEAVAAMQPEGPLHQR